MNNLEALIECYLDICQYEKKLSQDTLKAYRTDLAQFRAFVGGAEVSQDAFALESQRKAIAAIDAGRFKDEIIPVEVPQGRKKPPIIFDTDEFPRRDTNAGKMAKLKPCFNIGHDDQGRIFNTGELTGTVTAASSSGRNDGASAMLLMAVDRASELGLRPMARIIGMGTAGCDPRTMGLGPGCSPGLC